MDSGWLDILSRLPGDLDLNQLARDTKAIQRLRGITDAADLLRLALARGPGGRTLKQTAAWAKLVKVPSAEPMEYQMRADCAGSPRSPRRRCRIDCTAPLRSFPL